MFIYFLILNKNLMYVLVITWTDAYVNYCRHDIMSLTLA